MEALVSEYQDIYSNWIFVGAFEQSFDPSLDHILVRNKYFAVYKSLGPEPIFKRIFMIPFPCYLDSTEGTGDIPTKLLQPVPELKVDITSMETISSEWTSGIPPRLLKKIYVVHVENITSYRGIDVRPGMCNIFFTGSSVSSPEALEGETKLWPIPNGDCTSKYFPLSEIFGGLSSLGVDQIADVVMNPVNQQWRQEKTFLVFYT